MLQPRLAILDSTFVSLLELNCQAFFQERSSPPMTVSGTKLWRPHRGQQTAELKTPHERETCGMQIDQLHRQDATQRRRDGLATDVKQNSAKLSKE